jgi:hypothetical protein
MLDDPNDPSAMWLRQQLNGAAKIRADYRRNMPARRVHRPVLPASTSVGWDILGMAVDLRIRSAFTSVQLSTSIGLGIAMAGPLLGRGVGRIGEQLKVEYLGLAADHGASRRGLPWVLPDDAEDRLARVCIALVSRDSASVIL